MHISAIVNRRDVRSLRDLNGAHLAMLKNIRDTGACDRLSLGYFGVDASGVLFEKCGNTARALLGWVGEWCAVWTSVGVRPKPSSVAHA